MKPEVTQSIQFFDKDKYSVANAGVVIDRQGNLTNLSTDNVFAVVPCSQYTPTTVETWDSFTKKLQAAGPEATVKQTSALTLDDIADQIVLHAAELPNEHEEAARFTLEQIEVLTKLYRVTSSREYYL